MPRSALTMTNTIAVANTALMAPINPAAMGSPLRVQAERAPAQIIRPAAMVVPTPTSNRQRPLDWSWLIEMSPACKKAFENALVIDEKASLHHLVSWSKTEPETPLTTDLTTQ